MTIKELKELMEKYPPSEHEWRYCNVSGDSDSGYTDNDDVVSIRSDFISNCSVVTWKRIEPKPTLSKEKLDKVIELNRHHFKTPFLDRNKTWEELKQAEEDCGEQIYDSGLLDIIGAIVLSTRAHDTPNETVYKVFEALGYEIK